MSNDKNLADVQPGGAVRLGGELPPLPNPWYRPSSSNAPFDLDLYSEEQIRDYARAALSAQPSPAGQGDALAMIGDNLRSMRLLAEKIVVTQDGSVHLANIKNEIQHALQLLEFALAARQPVGQITDSDIDTRLNALYREMVDSGQHNGGMSGVAWDRAVYRMASSPPVQAWVVADGQGERWRMWGDFGPAWTTDRDQALHFARRAEAEAFANDDEDAWLIQPVGTPAQAVDDRFPNGLCDAIEYANEMEEAASAVYEKVFGYEDDGEDCGTVVLRRVLHHLNQQTAQAVDLGKFREAVESRRGWAQNQYDERGDTSMLDVVKECDRLLALIEGKAVGNG